MAKIFLLLSLMFVSILAVHAKDATNTGECVETLQNQLEKHCTTLFGSNNKDLEKTCLDSVITETEKQCERFFGTGKFCSVCTTECINNYKEDDPTRIACLQTCLKNPACES